MLSGFVDLRPGDFVIQNGANSAVGISVVNAEQVLKSLPMLIIRSAKQSFKLPSLEVSRLLTSFAIGKLTYSSHLGFTYILSLVSDPTLNRPQRNSLGLAQPMFLLMISFLTVLPEIKLKVGPMERWKCDHNSRYYPNAKCACLKGIRLGLNCVGMVLPMKVYQYTHLFVVGGKETTMMARLLDNNAHLVSYGGMAKQPLSLPVSLFIFKNLTCRGFWQSLWYKEKTPAEREELMQILVNLLKEHKVWQVHIIAREVPNPNDTSRDSFRPQTMRFSKYQPEKLIVKAQKRSKMWCKQWQKDGMGRKCCWKSKVSKALSLKIFHISITSDMPCNKSVILLTHLPIFKETLMNG